MAAIAAGRPWKSSWTVMSSANASSVESWKVRTQCLVLSRLYGGPMASVKQIQVTFDCAEPERVARFWCEVLGYVVPPPPEGFATWDDFDRALPPEHQGFSVRLH
jgi:glyoxalase superfamily protein